MTWLKWKTKQRKLQIGDLVPLTEPNLPRREWITVNVIETFPGKDNLKRVEKIMTFSGGCSAWPTHKLVRPGYGLPGALVGRERAKFDDGTSG